MEHPPPRPRISFVMPAHNEERLIGRSLDALFAAAREVGEPFEVIVVDDSSTDWTGEIAAARGARVLRVEHRKISATRNAGASAARGEILYFVDADTLVNTPALLGSLRALEAGAVGGGCMFTFDGRMPLWARALYPLFVWVFRTRKLVGGCFVFCTRAAFERVGGFREEYFAAEELLFARDLKRLGRFVLPRETVVTSGRKLRTVRPSALLALLGKVVVRGPRFLQRRDELDVWYGERQSDPDFPRGC
jgi:glycosyltransferase involved in cell wall biosynthesis